MNIVNLTPHELNICNAAGETVSIPPSGTIARVAETRVQLRAVNGIPVTRAEYGAVEGLPEPQEGAIYVVSALVLGRCGGRSDVFAPGTAVRDAEGRVIGCSGLSAAPDTVTVHPGFLWSIENEAADSYGYGSQFGQDVLAALDGQPASAEAQAVARWLEATTPQKLNLSEVENVPGVSITQERRVTARRLIVHAKMSDGMGDWREETYTISSTTPDPVKQVTDNVRWVLAQLES